MQRRAAAVSVAFFLVVAAGAYAFIGAAEKPTIQIEDPDYTMNQGDVLEVGDRTYTFTKIGDGTATATWTNESARWTATMKNGSVVQYDGQNWTVYVNPGDDPTRFRLQEVQKVDKETTKMNGTTYVVLQENGNRTLVPRDKYLPEPEKRFFAEGDDFPYQGNTTTVADVTKSGVVLEWFAPKTNTVKFSEGSTTTLNGVEYIAHFQQVSNGEEAEYVLELTDDLDDYNDDVQAQQYFRERIKGLWGVTILSSLAAAFILMLSFLPSRY